MAAWRVRYSTLAHIARKPETVGETFVAAQLAGRDASITALQGAKADATLLDTLTLAVICGDVSFGTVSATALRLQHAYRDQLRLLDLFLTKNWAGWSKLQVSNNLQLCLQFGSRLHFKRANLCRAKKKQKKKTRGPKKRGPRKKGKRGFLGKA